jgi:hypothetical protein
MLSVVQFRWCKSEPEFLVRWSKKGVIANPADLVLLDMPDECLKILWKRYRKDMVVMDWINSLVVMKKAVKGWKDIESFAAKERWEGSYVVSNVAAGPKTKKNSFGELMDTCAGLSESNKPTLENHKPTLETGPAVGGGKLGVIVCVCVRGVTNCLLFLFLLPQNPSEEKEDEDDDPNGDDGPRLIKDPYCKLVDHTWETCVNGNYVEANGVLYRRSCFVCPKKFCPGTMSDGIDGKI